MSALGIMHEAGLIVTVLGSYTRLFKDVFAQANSQLMDVFGMQLVELPRAEKVTLRQKRGMQFITTVLSLT